MGQPVDAVLQLIPEAVRQRAATRGRADFCLLHVTTETANLAITLRDGGAEVVLCASNPLSTQDDVAASLVEDFISGFCHQGRGQRYLLLPHISALEHRPQITMDDGADLVTTILSKRPELTSGVLGGTEETTTGVVRLRSMAKNGVLKYPSSPSMMQTRNTFLIIVTAPANPLWTVSFAPPTCCWRA